MSLNKDYNIAFTRQDINYNIQLVQGQKSDLTVVINGISYSVLTDQAQAETVKQILNTINFETLSSKKELSNRIKVLSDVSAVKIHSIGTDKLGNEELRKKERQMAVENGLVPLIPSPNQSIQTASIEQRMQELGVPGVSITVINKGKIEWSSGYGELNKSVLIQAASISKTVTALTVLSLIDQCLKAEKEGIDSGLRKNINLETDVSTLLDEELWRSIDPDELTKGDKPKMTILTLLSHTAGTTVSGFDGYPRLEEIEKEIVELNNQIAHLEHSMREDPIASSPQNLEKLKEKLQKLKELQSKAFKELPTVDQILKGEGNSGQVKIVDTPGSRFNYSGGGTTILQKIVEVVTGQDFDKVVKDRVLNKLGMEKSTYFPKESDTCHGNGDDCSPIPGRWNAYPELGPAGLWSTPNELANMALGVKHALEGKGIISQELANKMLTAQTEKTPNGLGIFVEETQSSKYFFHQGSNQGFRCIFVANSEGKGAVVMTNSDYGEHLYKEIMSSIARTYKWPDEKTLPMFKSPLTPEEVKAINHPPTINMEKWQEYVGKYQFEKHIVEVNLSNGKVFVKVDQGLPFEVNPLTDQAALFRTTNPGPLNILRFKQAEDSLILNLFGADHHHTS